MVDLTGIKVAILTSNGFEESELIAPRDCLREAGATVHILAEELGEVQGYQHQERGRRIAVDHTLAAVRPSDYDALQIPGGVWNTDQLRTRPKVLALLQAFDRMEKPIAAICHAPWLLVSAGLVRGRTLTSYPSIQDDIRNAGGHWVDASAVDDGNWVTSRQPKDLPTFNAHMLKAFQRARGQRCAA